MHWVQLPSQHVLDEVFARLVTASDQGAARNVKESHILCDLPPPVELSRIDITVDLHVTFRWAHVLSEGHDVDIDLAQLYFIRQYNVMLCENKSTFECIQHLFLVLPNAKHNTGFGNTDALLLCLLEDLETLPERGPPVSDEWCKSFNGFDVMRVDIQARFCNH